MGMEWQPIETAPTNTPCLIFVPSTYVNEKILCATFTRIEKPHWRAKDRTIKYIFQLCGCPCGVDPDIYGATHWMPLPLNPKE